MKHTFQIQDGAPKVDQISDPTDRGNEMPEALLSGHPLDAILKADEFARLLQMPRRTFDKKVARREIVPIEIGGHTNRFNLRMNLARWMHEARMPAVVIAASFGYTPERKI